MICAICGEREAVVFMRRSGGNGSGDVALCAECARERGLSVGKGKIELRFEDLLQAPSADAPSRPVTCPQCGLSQEELRAEGRLGCLGCAAAFRPEIERYLRARSMGPLYVPDGAQGPGATLGDAAGKDPGAALRAALAAEDYEKAAAIRDGLAPASGKGESRSPVPASFDGFPYAMAVLGTGEQALLKGPDGAPDSDVVLESRARLQRNYLPPAGASRRFASHEERRDLVAALASVLPSLPVHGLAGLDPLVLAALVEAGALPRAFALDVTSSLALSPSRPVAVLLGAGDSLSIQARLAGLDPSGALEAANGMASSLEALGPYAFDAEFGFLCEKLCDFGSGLALEALLHLPALGQEGQLEKALRSLLAHGFQVRGFYGSEAGSSGDLYEVVTDHAYGQAPSAMARDFREVIARIVEAERRARAKLASAKAEELLDRAGRGLGLLRNCRFVGAAEAAAALSSLRLAALAGFLPEPGPAALGARLRALGPAAVRLAGPAGAPGGEGGLRRGEERARARLLAKLLEGSMLEEGGRRCSRD
jgi:protein-arginine kinase/protein-arginine kinase activator protein McsA